jgi:hypothetical protein
MGKSEPATTADRRFETFKFYEEAAEKTKNHAWTQTTWILALNAGIMAFSVNFYAANNALHGFRVIEVLSTIVGLMLCAFLIYLLNELGSHISNYWTTSNRIASADPWLVPIIGEGEAGKARGACYHAKFPPFCRRLQMLTVMFMVAHAGWIFFVFSM